ncbi:MAG: hypothetical protein WB715_13710 [Roseiarcus sp.]|uniref:hypothetical protein n=1 Tax=Roseiarcus sp. TaxID=1969460 RepID=UPI003C517B23
MTVTAPRFESTPALRQAQDEEARAWAPPQGHADIAPSRYGRIEGDGHLTIDAHSLVPALLRSVPIEGRVLERAAGPFPDDGSPLATRVEPAPRRLVGRPQNQALTQ